ncbi:putative lipoprotein YlaJ [Lentibacillus sp. JNUCC-1]|uniref:YhcN/YlaJ family sporulation lipoprotein n=1 Tax=Lentibacillus sp. JNUCC-1 TaxID=2654513 RepID=UPI0012E72F65|nr:YhcN/YlaJ family sporulation lipoprotein [Lentibacillus sp. JNUCC-1]MUV36258.1 putative lipoprotein YlaJ [Lentibacillus sp. JNUCC-1]
MIRFIIFTLLSAVVLSGCMQNKDEALPREDTKQSDRIVQVKDSNPHKQKRLSNQEIADHLSHVASDVPSVSDAASVVAGPYAVVAIDVDKDLDRSRVGTIKYSVIEALQHDPYGKSAVVVADGDILERVRRMGDKIAQGYPIQGIIDELSAIVGRYMPELPPAENRPKERDQNKDVIPKEEKQELDQKEKDQSNDHKQKD